MKEIIVKKTHEVTDAEWLEITAGFNEEFKREKTPAELIKYYRSTHYGYSYHGIAKGENGLVAGFSSIVPYMYRDAEGKEFLTGLSGGTFVKKEFRNDIFIFNDIYKALRLACTNDGMATVLGVPNKNSFKYLVKLLRFTFLYNLPYYVLPVKIPGTSSRTLLQPFNALYFIVIWLYAKAIGFVSLFYNPVEKEVKYNISFSPETYTLRFNEAYTSVTEGPISFTYRIYHERNMNIAYLFQFTQGGKRNLKAMSKAINHIITKEKVGLVIFVGKLSMTQPLLLKLPEKKQPQQLPLTIDVLLPVTDKRYASFKEPANWNFGLMNFDVR